MLVIEPTPSSCCVLGAIPMTMWTAYGCVEFRVGPSKRPKDSTCFRTEAPPVLVYNVVVVTIPQSEHLVSEECCGARSGIYSSILTSCLGRLPKFFSKYDLLK